MAKKGELKLGDYVRVTKKDELLFNACGVVRALTAEFNTETVKFFHVVAGKPFNSTMPVGYVTKVAKCPDVAAAVKVLKTMTV